MSILSVLALLFTTSCQKKASMNNDKGTEEKNQVIQVASEPMKLSSSDETITSESIYFASEALDFISLEDGETTMLLDSIVSGDHVFLMISISNNKRMFEMYNLADEKRGEGKNEEAEQIEDSVWEETNRNELFILDKDGNLKKRMEADSIFPEETDNVRLYPALNDEVLLHVRNFLENDAVSDFLYRMDADGNIKGERILVPSLQEEGVERHYESFAIDENENLYAKGYCSSESEFCTMLDIFKPDGSHLFSLKGDSDTFEGSNFENLYISNQTVYLMIAEGMSGGKSLCRIDLEKQELVSEAKISSQISAPDFRDGMFFFSDVEGIKSVELDSQTMETFLEWKDTDLRISQFQSAMIVLSSDKVLAYVQQDSSDSASSDSEWFLLSRTSENPNAGKEVIRVGGYGASYYSDIGYAVEAFNKISEDQRVEFIDFSTWGADEESMDQVRMNILSGDVPDILISAGEFDFSILAQKGLLADLSPLIENDVNFSKENYADIMFTLPKIEEKLFYTFTDYYLSGLLVRKNQVSEASGWSIQELREKLNSISDLQPFTKISQESFLYLLTQAAFADLVDFTNKKVSFDSGSFEEILRFAQEYGCLPEEVEMAIEHGMRMEYVEERDRDKIRNGDLFLSVADGYVGFPMGWRWLWNEAGSDVTLAGIPTQSTSRVLCNPGKMIAIAENGKKEPAWEFLKILLSQEAQQKLSEETLPVHQGQLHLLLEEQKNPPDEAMKADALIYQLLTDEAIQEFYAIQNRAAALGTVDAEIMGIVISEAQAYFAGQKTLEATVEVIQNRALTYVNQL